MKNRLSKRKYWRKMATSLAAALGVRNLRTEG